MDEEMTTDVEQSENLEVEELQENVIPTKYVYKVVQNFMKCVGSLILHVENVVSNSNGIIITNSQTVLTNDGIKQDPNDSKKHLKNVKMCFLKLCLVCINKNIFIESDIKFAEIAFYSCIDEYTKSLVLDYLTEIISSLINHISNIKDLFNEQKGKKEAKNISKSLLKLYKEILYIPLNPNLDNTSLSQTRNCSLWYDEAKQNLTEKLILLRTVLNKLKKIFKKKIPNPNPITIESDTSESSKRKTKTSENTQVNRKRKRNEINVGVNEKSEDTVSVKTKKKKSKTQETNNETDKDKHKKSNSEHTEVKKKNFEVHKVEIIKTKNKSKTKDTNNKENSSDREVITELLYDENDKDKQKKTKSKSKDYNKENQLKNHQKSPNKNRSISESSDLNIENLFTIDFSTCDGEVTLPPCKDKDLESARVLTMAELTKNLKTSHKLIQKRSQHDDTDTDMHEEILFGSGDYESKIVGEENDNSQYEKIIEQYDLNANERYVVLQGMLNDLKKEREITDELKAKLYNLRVKINFNVPESHKIETRLAGGPTPQEQKSLARFNLIGKRFNKIEDETIRRNWAEFCSVHCLDGNPEPFTKIRHGFKGCMTPQQRIKFGQFLGKDLPHRALSSIYRRFKALFNNCNKKGRYTLEEDSLILIYFSRTPGFRQHFGDIAYLLKRPRSSVEQRYRVLTNPYGGERIEWTMAIENQIIKSLLKTTGSKNIKALSKTTFSRDQFKKIEKIVNIDYVKLHVHFYKFMYSKLFSPKPLKSSEIRCKLVELLEETGETDWHNLDWKEITTNFEGVTTSFLMGQLNCALQKAVPKKYHNDLPKVLKYLRKHIKEYEALGKIPFTPRSVRRYCWTDHGLEMID